ncbi:MAG: hypothetical protein HYW51_01310 [Candidatus Doudnabacteria bacterium]|nr:hypothetical protein [Candidatus Doudnabacteria bacterium]
MQYAVPQFTDVEDKLIGPLTLKQFLLLVATGGVIMFFWSILGVGIIFFFFALPTALLGAAITFGRFNGRQFFSYILPFATFMMSPKLMVFKREEPTVTLAKKTHDKTNGEGKKTEIPEPEEAGSRLKKLAYLLDQKTEEEKQLLESESN